MEGYIRNDQIYNIPSRQIDDIMLTSYDRTWKPFWWIPVPSNQVQVFFVDEKDQKNLSAVLKNEGPVAWIPAYVDATGKQIYHPASARTDGKITRLLGRRTMVSHDQNQYQILKYSPSLSTSNSQFAQHSIQTTKYLRELFNDYGTPKSFAIIEEPLAISYRGSGHSYPMGDSFSIIARSTEEFDRAHKEGYQVESTHALFGCTTCLEEIAKSNGHSPEDWIIKEFIPKYANVLAEAHVQYGLILESHTQNMLVVLDKSGTIQRFLYRDLAGIMIDPTSPLSRGSRFLTGLLNFKSVNKLFTSFSVAEKMQARDFGMHFSMYGIQSIDRIFDSSKNFEFAKSFLKRYREASEQILGTRLMLSASGESDWQKFFSSSSGLNLPVKWKKRGNFRDSIAYLMEEIYTQVQNQRLHNLKNKILKAPSQKQFSISELAYDFELKDLVYVSSSARQKVERQFTFSITKIWRQSPALTVYVSQGVKYILDENKDILAYSMEFFDIQKSCFQIFN